MALEHSVPCLFHIILRKCIRCLSVNGSFEMMANDQTVKTHSYGELCNFSTVCFFRMQILTHNEYVESWRNVPLTGFMWLSTSSTCPHTYCITYNSNGGAKLSHCLGNHKCRGRYHCIKINIKNFKFLDIITFSKYKQKSKKQQQHGFILQFCSKITCNLIWIYIHKLRP